MHDIVDQDEEMDYSMLIISHTREKVMNYLITVHRNHFSRETGLKDRT